jgi:RNA polymerase sigma-70 factor (ECF subfamily)
LPAAAAEDLLSEARARALARPVPGGVTNPAQAQRWLAGILHNLCADEGRRAARTARAHAALRASPPAAAATPEEALLEDERRRLLHQALPTLPAELRQLLHERFWDGRDDAAIARARGVRQATVRTRVHRAVGRLRGLLSGLRAVFPVAPFSAQAAAVALLPLGLAAVLGGPVAPAEVAPGGTATATRARPSLEARPITQVPAPPARARRAPQVLPARPAPAASEAVKRFDFDDDEVAGDLQRPDDLLLLGAPAKLRQPSLLEIPSSFTPALIKMIEDL